MAVSCGLVMLCLVLHVIGNLKVFLGAAALDGYAAWLRTVLEPVLPYGGMLWIIRVVGCHVRHGLCSAPQPLGWSTGARQRALKGMSTAVAVLVTAGFLSVPFAVTFGLV